VAVQASKYRQISDDERKFLNSASKETSFERQRLLSLINNMGEAVVATDKKGKILLYNAAVLNLLDTNQTLEGKSLDSLLSLKDAKEKPVKLTDLLKDNPIGVTSTDFKHEFAPNDVINLYINMASVKLGFREELESGYIVIMRDITKDKSLEEERDEFISVVSHELRTPVAIAEGNISNAIFMNSNAKNAKMTKDSLDQAHEQVVFLANMINDLATLSRAERTDVVVDISTVDPAQLLHSLGRDYESEAATKNLKLMASSAKDISPINTSELYLHEILQNFITNAIKYTKSGSIVVHVRNNKAGEAVFSVADTGIGLSKADQKRVFDKFFRSEDFRTRESSGTGLGLYVTAKLAHKLGATITLESELNKGTTFTITVPSLKKPRKS
jgi:two-component system sensor histidine kinase VicK